MSTRKEYLISSLLKFYELHQGEPVVVKVHPAFRVGLLHESVPGEFQMVQSQDGQQLVELWRGLRLEQDRNVHSCELVPETKRH